MVYNEQERLSRVNFRHPVRPATTRKQTHPDGACLLSTPMPWYRAFSAFSFICATDKLVDTSTKPWQSFNLETYQGQGLQRAYTVPPLPPDLTRSPFLSGHLTVLVSHLTLLELLRSTHQPLSTPERIERTQITPWPLQGSSDAKLLGTSLFSNSSLPSCTPTAFCLGKPHAQQSSRTPGGKWSVRPLRAT